jgi:hypothetical protein
VAVGQGGNGDRGAAGETDDVSEGVGGDGLAGAPTGPADGWWYGVGAGRLRSPGTWLDRTGPVHDGRAGHAQQRLDRGGVGTNHRRRGGEDQPTVIEHGDPVGHLDRVRELLFDEEDTQPGRSQSADEVAKPGRQVGGEPFARLVEQQHPGPGEDRPGDREHLLFAAGELVAAVPQSLAQPGQQLQDLWHRPHGTVLREPGAPDTSREGQVLGHGQPGEDPTTLRHQADAGPGHPVRGPACQIDPVDPDRAPIRPQQAGDRVHQGALSRAVAPDHRLHRAGRHLEVDAVQHRAPVVAGVEAAHPQHHRTASA